MAKIISMKEWKDEQTDKWLNDLYTQSDEEYAKILEAYKNGQLSLGTHSLNKLIAKDGHTYEGVNELIYHHYAVILYLEEELKKYKKE